MPPSLLLTVQLFAELIKLDSLGDDERSSPASGPTGLGLGVAPASTEHLVENRAAVSGVARGLVVLERPGAGDGIRRPRSRAVNEESRPRLASVSREVDRPGAGGLVNRETRVARIEQAGLKHDRRDTAVRRRSRSTSEVAAEVLHETIVLSTEARAEDRPRTELAELIVLNEVDGNQSLSLLGLGSRRRAEEVQDLEIIDRRTVVRTRAIRVAEVVRRVGHDLVLRSARREIEVREIAILRLVGTPEERLALSSRVRDVAGVAVKEHALDLAGRTNAPVGRAVVSADAVSGDLAILAVEELHRSLEVIRTARIRRSRANRVTQTAERNSANHRSGSTNNEFLHFVNHSFFTGVTQILLLRRIAAPSRLREVHRLRIGVGHTSYALFSRT